MTVLIGIVKNIHFITIFYKNGIIKYLKKAKS